MLGWIVRSINTSPVLVVDDQGVLWHHEDPFDDRGVCRVILILGVRWIWVRPIRGQGFQ
jgi:hypothetical protein